MIYHFSEILETILVIWNQQVMTITGFWAIIQFKFQFDFKQGVLLKCAPEINLHVVERQKCNNLTQRLKPGIY